MDNFIYIYKKRIDLKNNNRLIIQTGSCAEYMKDVKAVSYVNGVKTEVVIKENPHTPLLFVYKNAEPEFDSEYNLCIELPNQVDSVSIVLTKDTYPSGRVELTLSKGQIEFLRKHMELNLIGAGVDNATGKIKVTGWVEASEKPELCAYSGKHGLKSEVNFFCRRDMVTRYLDGEIYNRCGFEMTIENTGAKKIRLTAVCGGRYGEIKIGINQAGADERKKQEKLAIDNRTDYITRAKNYIAVYGMKRFLTKVYGKLTKQAEKGSHNYFTKINPTQERLNEQRGYQFENRPMFSVIIPVYRPQESFFTAMLNSVAKQTYDNWQFCIADGGGEGYTMEKAVQPFLDRYGSDKVKYVKLAKNLGIADNTNAALELADGDYMVFGDHDDELHPTALFECMRVIEKNPETDFIYSDEDKIIEATGKHTQAHFKSDLNMELLRHNNYICHLVVVKRGLAEQVGRLNGEYNGAQDHDYVLRCVEKAQRVHHIPRILYHWRINENSTAKTASTKNYANEAGKAAVMAHLNRAGIAGEVKDGVVPGFYDVYYKVDGEPLISVIIPNKDHIDDLERCMDSLDNNNSYRNIEYIVVENNSTLQETFEAYERLRSKYGERFRLVKWDAGFNYSAINNYGVRYAKGEYILLLNNDTEIIEADTIRYMLSQCQHHEVGIVGAKLLYDDGTVQHGGVVLGYQGVAGHAFVGLHDDEYGYFARAVAAQEVTAVTAACLLTKRSVFDEVEGLDESFEVAFNDIDFCMKVRSAGYKVIYEPHAKLHHYEYKSRGAEDNAAKQERFGGEIMHFIDKWREALKAGDPYYNANLELVGTLYKIKDI